MTSIGNPVGSPHYGATRPTALGQRNALENNAQVPASPQDTSGLSMTPASQQDVYNAYIMGAQQGQVQAHEDHKGEFQFGLKSAGHFVKGAVINPVVDLAKFATSGPIQFAATVGTGALLASSAGAALAPLMLVLGAGAAVNYGAKFVGKLMSAENGQQRAEAFEDLGAATTSAFGVWKGAVPALAAAQKAGTQVKGIEAAAAASKAAEAAKTASEAGKVANAIETSGEVAKATAEAGKVAQTVTQTATAATEGVKTAEAAKATVSSLEALGDVSKLSPFQAIKQTPGVLIESTFNAGKLAVRGDSWTSVPDRMIALKDVAKAQAKELPGQTLVAKDKAANWLLKVGHEQPKSPTVTTTVIPQVISTPPGSALATSEAVTATASTKQSQGLFSWVGNFFNPQPKTVSLIEVPFT